MKSFNKIVVIYTIIMVTALAVIVKLFSGMKLIASNVASYSGQELDIYKQVWNNTNESFDENKHRMFVYMLAFWCFALVLGYLFIVIIYFAWIKPVREMESFASEIAKGNLDIKLPMHKNSISEGFTESFDLMREELKASRIREMEAEKAKREMVAELSHDLKTPVATIQATCEVMELKLKMELEKAQDEDKIKMLSDNLEKVGYISNKSETINQLVQSVFHATLDDMEEVKIKPEETDSRIIEGCIKNLKEYGNIILENHIPECLVYIDKLRMEQVIDNIVGNSYKYAGTDIHVSFDTVKNTPDKISTDNGFVKITIRDEGPGVNENDLPLIIEKYYRGESTKEKQGYGLGMYLANYYMEKQGGGMEYYNENGFVVELLVRKV